MSQRRNQPRLDAPQNGRACEEQQVRKRRKCHKLTAYSLQLTAEAGLSTLRPNISDLI
jgi:hypothetical protein